MLLIVQLGHTAYAENTATNSPTAEQLRKEIAQLQSDIEANQQKKSDSLAQLRRHDLRIAKLSRLIQTIDKQLTDNQTQLNQLRQQQHDLTQQSLQHRQQLAKMLNQMYRVGNQDLLRILLTVDDPGSLQRQLNYYSYFSRARLGLLGELEKTQKTLHGNELALKQKRNTLSLLHSDRNAELTNLQKAKAIRGEFLSSINRTISDQQSQLKEMQDNLANLQNLISDLDAPPQIPEPKLAFASLKGELAWPVSGGAIIEKFGNLVSGVKRQGVLIAASEEQSVYPVASGKVLYADWLRGFGMLLIIDHGGQYMSLYGHNNALFCNKGDWVNPRQQIASVGNSGAGDKIGLYFELRYKGKPINPKPWFKR